MSFEPIMVRFHPDREPIPHSLAEYVRLWRGVDREAAQAMLAPLEDDDAPRPEA